MDQVLAVTMLTHSTLSSAAMTAQGAATVAVGGKAKDLNLKHLRSGCSFCLPGITEPAFRVNAFPWPFLLSLLIAGAVGGGLASILAWTCWYCTRLGHSHYLFLLHNLSLHWNGQLPTHNTPSYEVAVSLCALGFILLRNLVTKMSRRVTALETFLKLKLTV